MTVRFQISKMSFSGGKDVVLDDGAIVVIVGPNNAGKSALLKDLSSFVRGGIAIGVLTNCVFGMNGSNDDVKEWLKENFSLYEHRNSEMGYQGLGVTVQDRHVDLEWRDGMPGAMGTLGPAFLQLTSGFQQKQVISQEENVDTMREGPRTALQKMYTDEEFEAEVSRHFSRAFGTGVYLNRMAGKSIPLMIGEAPEIVDGEKVFSESYLEKLRNAPRMSEQGDGMQAFVGAVLLAAKSPSKVLCMDEPELFLHPCLLYTSPSPRDS